MNEFIRTIEIKELRKEAKKHGLMMNRSPTKMSITTMLPEGRPKKLGKK